MNQHHAINLKDLFLKFETDVQLDEVKIFFNFKKPIIFFDQDDYIYGSFSLEELITAILDDAKALQLELPKYERLPCILRRKAI